MVLQLGLQTWFQELMKLTFLISHLKNNSLREKVIRSGFIQRETHSTDRVWGIAEGECGLKIWWG